MPLLVTVVTGSELDGCILTAFSGCFAALILPVLATYRPFSVTMPRLLSLTSVHLPAFLLTAALAPALRTLRAPRCLYARAAAHRTVTFFTLAHAPATRPHTWLPRFIFYRAGTFTAFTVPAALLAFTFCSLPCHLPLRLARWHWRRRLC